MLLLVIAFVLIGSHLGSRHSTQICLALFFPQAPPPLLPSPFFSDETDATLQSLLRHPVGGSCMGGVSGFSGDWASQRSVVDSLRILEKWRGDARTRPRRRLHRCAVVGSSSSLLQHTFGYEIDRADWVIRINDAPTPVSLHAYVGRRTDVVVKTHETLTHLEGFHALPAQAGVLRVYYCHVPWVSRCWMEAAHDGYERLSPRLITWARQSIRTLRWPTSGAMAIALSLHLCNSTRLYGFGPDTESLQKESGTTRDCAKYYGPCHSWAYYSGSDVKRAPHKFWHDWQAEARWIDVLRSSAPRPGRGPVQLQEVKVFAAG